MQPEDLRRVALDLPGTVEQPHFDSASFRVRGRIFVTLPPGGDRAHIFLDEQDVREAIAEHPAACEELRWGKRLSGVIVHLRRADPDLVTDLVIDAWRRRAPAAASRLVDETRSRPGPD